MSGQRHAPSALSPGNRPGVISQETGWALGLVLTGVENLVSTGIRFPDRPVRSKSLSHLESRK